MIDQQRQSDSRGRWMPIALCAIVVLGYAMAFPLALERGLLGPVTGFFVACLLITLASCLRRSKSAADRRERDFIDSVFGNPAVALSELAAQDDEPGELALSAIDDGMTQGPALIAFDVPALVEEAIAWAVDRCDTSTDRCRTRIDESSCGFLYGQRDTIALALGEAVAFSLIASGDEPIVIEVSPDPDDETRVSFSVSGSNPPSETDITALCEESDELVQAQRLFEEAGGSLTMSNEANEGFHLRFVMVNRAPAATDGKGRASARLLQDGVTCSQGDVLDISRHGIRIETSRAPRGTIDLSLNDGQITVELRAKPVWSKRLNWRRFEVGLVFVDLTPAQEKGLTELAMINRGRLTLGGDSITAAA